MDYKEIRKAIKINAYADRFRYSAVNFKFALKFYWKNALAFPQVHCRTRWTGQGIYSS